MDIGKEHVGKRLLVKERYLDGLRELTLLEVSPQGLVKISYGTSSTPLWYERDHFTLLEVLDTSFEGILKRGWTTNP